jgi:DNA-binding IclR family transcriptional regulator
MHVAAGAKAILAFTDPEVVDSMIKGELEKFTENTITDIKIFKDQLKEIKLHGIAYDHGEANKDVHAVSAPVLNQFKEPIAAISICVPASRINKILNNKVVIELKEAASRISERLLPRIRIVVSSRFVAGPALFGPKYIGVVLAEKTWFIG